LIERRLGRGTVFTMTTPISETARPEGRKRWNDLTLGNALPYFVLVNELCDYLVESGNNQLNYFVGQSAVLPNDADQYPEQYQLFTPTRATGKDEPPKTIKSDDSRIVYRFTEEPGAYRLKGSRGGSVVRGFCVNLPAEESDLERIEQEQLDQLLGAGRYQFASNREEINRGQGEARVGREFFSFLVLTAVLLLALEYLLANRFYQSRTSEASTARSTLSSMREVNPTP
jgi:hypothetical protein